MCSGFPPPQAALVTVASGEKGLWVVWCISGEIRVKEQGREIRIDRIQIYVELSMYGGGQESGSFRPWVVSAWVVSAQFWGGSFGLGRWVDSALGRFGRSQYQNVDCLGQADKQKDR